MAAPRETFPPFEVGVPYYPTPSSQYLLLVEKYSRENSDYVALDPLADPIPVYSGLDKDKYPGPLYLAKIVPDPSGLFEFRYWTNDRAAHDQDQWNFNITYDGENPIFPTYVRTYILPRDGYTPLAKLSRLPGAPSSDQTVLIKEQVEQLPDDDPLHSRYQKVIRLYSQLPGPQIISSITLENGLRGTRVEQVVQLPAVSDVGADVYSSEVKSDNLYWGTKTTVRAAVFDEAVNSKSQPVPIPEKFFADGASIKTQTEVSAGSDLTGATLGTDGTGVLEVSSQHIHANRVRNTVKELVGGKMFSVTEYTRLPTGQLGTRKSTLGPTAFIPTLNAFVADASVERRGPNQYITSVTTKSEVLPMQQYAVQVTPALPRKWMQAIGQATKEETVIGKAAIPVLTLRDLSKSETQLDAFTKRTTTTSLNISSDDKPITFTGYARENTWGGGGYLTTTDTNEKLPIPTGDRTIKSFNQETYPNGVVLTTVEKFNAPFPTLKGTEFDPTTGLMNSYEETWVDPRLADSTPSIIATDGEIVIKEYKPINDLHSLQTVRRQQVPGFEEQFAVADSFPLPSELVGWDFAVVPSKAQSNSIGESGVISLSYVLHAEPILTFQHPKRGAYPGILYRKWFSSYAEADAWLMVKKSGCLSSYTASSGSIVVAGKSVSAHFSWSKDSESKTVSEDGTVSVHNISECLCQGFQGTQKRSFGQILTDVQIDRDTQTGKVTRVTPKMSEAQIEVTPKIFASHPTSLSAIHLIYQRGNITRHGRYYVAEAVILDYASA